MSTTEPTLSPAVFLDRDGVLNRAPVSAGIPRPPASVEQLEVVPGAAHACEQLRAAGFATVLVTNQPDIARHQTTRAQVELINAAVARQVPLDDIRMCPHDDTHGCACRKPAPGMLFDAASVLGLDLGRSVIIGDRWRDIEAGRRAGCRTVLIDRPYAAEGRSLAPDKVVTALPAAVEWILSQDDLGGV